MAGYRELLTTHHTCETFQSGHGAIEILVYHGDDDDDDCYSAFFMFFQRAAEQGHTGRPVCHLVQGTVDT